MTKLPVVSGRTAGEVFAKLGYEYDHHTGSHMIYYHISGKHLSIPDHKELDRGTLKKLIKCAGITTEKFNLVLGRNL